MYYYLCCGKERINGYFHIDKIDYGNNTVCDLNKDWNFVQDSGAGEIYIKDGLEHMDSVQDFFIKAEKKLFENGKLIIRVPHYKAPSAYKLTHKHLFSWSYFSSIPEPHDPVKFLHPVSVKLELSNGLNFLNPIINLFPKWWEKIGYVESIHVVFQKNKLKPVKHVSNYFWVNASMIVVSLFFMGFPTVKNFGSNETIFYILIILNAIILLLSRSKQIRFNEFIRSINFFQLFLLISLVGGALIWYYIPSLIWPGARVFI